MTGELLETGWAFPVETDGRGDVATASGEDEIREAIRMVLGTAKGERVMRPEFGCAVHDHVFAAVTPATLRTIERDVRRAIDRWEPRVDVESVDAERADDPGLVDVTITYRVPALDRRSTLSYPFAIGEGER